MKSDKPLRGLKPFRKGLNIRLFQRIADWWLEQPKRLMMEDWGISLASGKELKRWAMQDICDPELGPSFIPSDYRKVCVPPCGTVGCIAGTADYLVNKKKGEFFSEERGREALGITYGEGASLFYTNHWPSSFEEKYDRAKTQKQRVKITIDRIKHFIETGD